MSQCLEAQKSRDLKLEDLQSLALASAFANYSGEVPLIYATKAGTGLSWLSLLQLFGVTRKQDLFKSWCHVGVQSSTIIKLEVKLSGADEYWQRVLQNTASLSSHSTGNRTYSSVREC